MLSENNYFPLSGNGGIVGLTEDEDKFRRWQICSPEVARVVSEFEDITVLKGIEHSEFHHHEDSKAFQEKLLTFRSKQDRIISLPVYDNYSTWGQGRCDHDMCV